MEVRRCKEEENWKRGQEEEPKNGGGELLRVQLNEEEERQGKASIERNEVCRGKVRWRQGRNQK